MQRRHPPRTDRSAHLAAMAAIDAELARAKIDLEDAWNPDDLSALERQADQQGKIRHARELAP